MAGLKRIIVSANDPTWARELKTALNRIIDEVNRNRIQGDGTTTKVERGVVSAYADALPPITDQCKRHMSLVLELDEEAAAELPDEEKWTALYYALGYERLQ